jgi:hypothetical protein
MDMNDFIRGRRRARPSDIDPEQAERIRDYLAASGEPIPDYLQPAPPSDWGGGPRGTPIREPMAGTEWLREEIARKRGIG